MRIIQILTASLILARASFASDFHSPRTAALGGAGHAGPVLNDAVYLNPSFASFLPVYGLSVNWAPLPKTTAHPYYNFSLLDGRTELFQAGVGTTRRGNDILLHLGASKSVIHKVGFGLGGKFVFSQDGTSVQDMTATVSALPLSWLNAVIVVDNVIQSQSAINHKMYREVILGTKFNVMGIVMLYVDPHFVPELPSGEKWGWEAGAELAIMSDLFIRAGTFRKSHIPWLNERDNGWGVGAGWMAPRLSIDYGLSHANGRDETAHIFGMTVYF